MCSCEIDSSEFAPELIEAAIYSKAWPFEEARKLIARIQNSKKDEVTFETGYSPSGLPHIGTFGEVLRTSMVQYAFRVLTKDKIPTKLIVFSDDMDGLRRIPDNIPNRHLLTSSIGQPLTKIPDPFGQNASFGERGNHILLQFLNTFEFDYEFISASHHYNAGYFDKHLISMMEHYDEIMNIMLPTLGEERRKTYSPFLPIHPTTGIVMQVPLEAYNPENGTIYWLDPIIGTRFETSVLSGACKMQWKADWALRWRAFSVDYEMYGKDHIDNAKVAKQICKTINGNPPEGFHYELFLDENGEKISKSRGNGITIDDWLTYASKESLALFMFRAPKTAKRLHLGIIPKAVDEYEQFLQSYSKQTIEQRTENPVWHIHKGSPSELETSNQQKFSFCMLLNLVSVSNADSSEALWAFIQRYAPELSPSNSPRLNRRVEYAIRYARDFIRPYKQLRTPTNSEKAMLMELDTVLSDTSPNASLETIQGAIYKIGRKYFPVKKKGSQEQQVGVSQQFFASLYQILLGQDTGPRFSSFVAIHGIAETRTLIAKAIQNGSPIKNTTSK